MARCARYKGQAPAATRGLSVSIFRPKARTLPRAPHSRSGRCGASRPDWICRLKVWRAATTCKATVLAPVQRSRSGARGEGRTRGRSLHSVTASARSTRTQSRQRTRVRSASLSWSLAHRHTAAWYRGPCSAALAILERRHSWRERSGPPSAWHVPKKMSGRGENGVFSAVVNGGVEDSVMGSGLP